MRTEYDKEKSSINSEGLAENIYCVLWLLPKVWQDFSRSDWWIGMINI
jgi:hypothetical protein